MTPGTYCRTSASRGTNQSGVKLYNERLVLSLIRTQGPLSKGQVASMTGLSAQAASVIMKQLESDGLLVRGAPQRGKVGQPSVPLMLNPEGAFSIGIKVGRRSADVAIMDLVGKMRHRASMAYAHPTTDLILEFIASGVGDLLGEMTGAQTGRIRGIGIAVPSEMWSWEEEIGAPSHIVEAWRQFDLKTEAERMFGLPVHLYNDATAACASELAFGEGRKYQDFLYIFFATLIGGGVVLDGSLYPGRQGYAGSIGSIPVRPGQPNQPPRRLVQEASIALFETALRKSGSDAEQIWDRTFDWFALGDPLDDWIQHASESVALAVHSAISVIDFQQVVIDGIFPSGVRTKMTDSIRRKVHQKGLEGVAAVEIAEGSIGSDARVLGAASLPLLADYAQDRDILFNQDPSSATPTRLTKPIQNTNGAR